MIILYVNCIFVNMVNNFMLCKISRIFNIFFIKFINFRIINFKFSFVIFILWHEKFIR